MATVDRLSRVRQLSSATPALRPMPTARPLTGLTSMVQPRRLNVVHRPKSFGSASLRRPKGDKGFFSNLGNLLTLPGQVAKGLPTFVGKVGQTIGGLGEGAYDLVLDVAAEATGADKEFYTSRFETDLEKGRKLGLKGTDLIAFASQRQYPAGGELIKSYETTAGDIGELATFGQADFGEPGFNLYQAYKRGDLPMRLLEDVGNVMLFGRMLGLGSVATRAGQAATNVGAPRLGRAVSRAGYFSEQPIAATLRGTAGLVGRGIERFGGDATAGRLGRVGQIAGRVRGSEQPIRMLGQASVENRRRLYQGRVPTEFRILDDLEARRDDYQRRGMEMPEAERAQLNRQQRRVETIVSRTGVPKLIARDQRKFANEQKANRDLYTQERTRFVERGPIPESPAKVRRQAERWAAEAERTSDPVKAEALRARSEQANKLVEAAEADTTNRMTDKQYIDDSAAAATLLTNGQWPTVAGRLADGTLSVDEALTVLRSDDLLAAYEAETGYTVTPGALQRAMDYATGRADIIDQVGIEQYIGIARRFSDYMTNLRQTGEGMVRGAASPLETGNYPMPEYLVSELQKASPQVRSLLNKYIGNIIDDLLSDAERQNPNIRAELGVEKTKPENLLKVLSDARPDSERYYLAALGVSEAFDEFSGTPDPRFSPIGEIPADLVNKVREFFRRPLIYPANVRYMMATEQRLLRLARSQETQQFADGLTQLVTEYPDLISDSLFESVMNAVNKANDETTRYDRKTWNELKNILAKVDRQLAESLERTSAEMGVLGGRRQNALIRINELRDSLRMAQEYVDTLVNNPEQLVPLKEAESGRLRGVAQEARFAREAMGEVIPAPAVDTTEARRPLTEENQRILVERRQVADELTPKQAEVARLRARQQRASEVADDDLASLQTELDEARLVRDEFSGTTEATIEEARAAKNREIQELTVTKQGLEARLPKNLGRFRRSDLTGRRPKFISREAYTDISEDLNGDIDAGTGGRKEVRAEFLRRYTETKETDSTQAWDEWSDFYARTNGIDDPSMALVDAARTFTALYDVNRRLAEVRKTKIETYREQLSDQQENMALDSLDRAYADAGVRSPEELVELIGDKTQPQGLNARLGQVLSEIDTLNRRAQELDQRLASNRARIEELFQQQEASIPFERVAEQGRLRTVEREATEQASQLESAALKEQQSEVKARLKGVGKTVDGEPRLQRQLERPLVAEQERLQQQQQQDARTIENLRTKYAEEDAAKLEAAQTLEGATEVSAQLARPTGAALLGEEQLIYYPAGPSRTVQDTATVSKRPRTEGMTPEMVASVERMRQGDVLALSPGQQAARVSEVLNNTGRNIIVQNIIKNRDYTTTVAEVLPQEVRDSLMAEATRMHEGKTNIESAERARLIKGDYQILVMRELSRQGLEPISTAGMPDPMDPFVERDAWRALNEPVPASAIEDNTILMTKGLRKNLVAEFEVAETRVPKAVQDVFQKVRYGTGSWKATILPFSIRWQIGDAVGNVLNAWVRGDITPTQMYKYVGIAYDMLRESQLTPEGQPSTLRSIMFGKELKGSMGDPLLQLLESFGLQQSGYKMMDVISMLREAADNREKGSPTLDVLEGNRARSTRAGQAFGQFQQGAFNFNEFQNRVARQAVALYNLDKYLKDNNLTFDDVTYERVAADKGLESAVIGAVGEANRVLGAFSELSPFERQVMRTIFPFWSWMKFINKAAAQLLIDQPDRVLFYGHLGSMMMEPDADGLWEFLQGKTNVFGKYVDLSFFNPYTDALLFTGKDVNQMIANAIEETQAISPAITLPLYGIGETFYQARGGQPFLFPTFSRPSYLEGRPGETTRSVGDTLGGLGYFTLRQLGGPLRNLPELLPSRIPLIAPEGRIRGTDIAVGSPGVPRFPQGSLRTTGRYSVRRLSPSGGRLSAIMRTFGLPGALVDVDVAQRAARENVLAGREARLRRIGERRAATGRF